MAPPAISTRLTRDLVVSILPPLKDDPQVLRQVTDHIAREVKADVQGSSRMTWGEVESSIAGLARTARVRVQSDLADALDKASGKLGVHRTKGEAAWEGDMPLKMSNLPQHIQFLLALSCQPNPQTHDMAHEYLHRPPPEIVDQDRLLFDEIMADPFEGDHWGKGYDSEVKEGWTDSDSSGDDRDEHEKIVTPLRERVGIADAQARVDTEQEGESRMREAEERMRRLGEGYWSTGGKLVEVREVGEGWRAVSTGLSVASLAIAIDGDAKLGVKALTGQQFQRELLFALSGRPGLMFNFYQDGKCFIVSDHPTVIHYSPVTVTSILENVRSRATQASLIRRYIQSALSPIASSSHHAPSKTSQAFAEACRVYLAGVDTWIADIELAFGRGLPCAIAESETASTPLSLQRQLNERYGTMLDCLSTALPQAGTPNDLLNALHSMINTIPRYRSELLQVLFTTATPIWAMLGDWLNRGMPIPRSLIDLDTTSDDERKLASEFWVYRDQDVSWADEDFWEAAFLLRDERPGWIDHQVLDLVLEAGKARGLLRELLGRELDVDSPEEWLPLDELVGQEDVDHFDLANAISNHLTPICQLTTFHLRRTLDEDCGLQAHLEAIDGLFYLRGFSTLQPWTEWLFSQVTTRKRWADFQVLTSTIREIIEKQNEHWLNPHAIRIRTTSRPRTQDPDNHILPETLSTIKASYQVPFPLSQLFTPTSLDLRADVFVFLLQMQFGRTLLAQTKSYESSSTGNHGLSDLLRLRHKLYFVINTIWVWITERVIEIESEKYKANLDKMTSFGEMIQLELKHVRQMREFALQHAKTAIINDSVKSIMELTSTIHDLFIALSQSTPTQSPPPPDTKYIQGRSRRRQRLAQSHRRRQAESSDSEDDDEDHGKANRTLGGEVSFAQLSLKERVERIQGDLERMVMTLKDGVEELARGEEGDEGAAEIWGMLAFALEDWR